MQGTNAVSMFDGAPELFSASSYFLDIGNNPVKIATVCTIDFFYDIQIIKILPVKNKIICTFDFGNTIDWKTNCLI